MVTTPRADDRRMRARLVAILVAGLLALGVGVAVASPPRSAAFDDADGRTWLPVAGPQGGDRLLLANGLSGLVEADATVDGGGGSPLRFVASRGRTTLLAGDGGRLVVVDDGTHRTATRTEPGAAALVPGGVLVLGDGGARLLPGDLAGPGRAVALPVPPVDGAEPVVDAGGRAWYLGEPRGGGGRVAVRLDLGNGGGRADGAADVVPVPAGTTGLLAADGDVVALGPGGATVVGRGGIAYPAPSSAAAGRIDPEIAVATGGTWATAAGSVVTTSGDGAGAGGEQDLGDDVRALAVWHGRVVAVTAGGAWTGPAGRLAAVPDVGPGATLHLDGGVLWITSGQRAVAIDPDHEQVAFDLTAADVSLCVGDCSAAAASSFLEDRATPPPTVPPAGPSPAPTTTQPPRRLEPAAVTPTLPTTSTTRAAAPTTTSTQPAAEVPGAAVTSAPATSVAATVPSVPPPASSTTTEDDRRPGRGNGGGGRDEPTTTSPPIVLPTILPTTTAPDPEPDPESTTTTEAASSTTDAEATTTTRPAAETVGLELDVTARPGEATVSLRVVARASDCGAEGTSTVATLLWQGATTGTRQLLVTWSSRGAQASNVATATIPSPPGQLSVSVVVCGVTASRTATVPADPSTTTTTPPSTTTPPTTVPATTTTTTPASTTPTTPTTSTTTPPVTARP